MLKVVQSSPKVVADALKRSKCVTLGAMALTLALTGCANDTSRPTAASAIGTHPAVSNSVTSRGPSKARLPGGDQGLILPVEAYMVNGAQLDLLSNAGSALQRKCMAQFGFTYSVTPSSAAAEPGQMARRYGVMSLAAAETFGYHPSPGDQIHQKGSADGSHADPRAGGQAALSPAESLVLTGRRGPSDPVSTNSPGAVNGRSIPAGGCQGQAKRQLGQSNTAGTSRIQGLMNEINGSGYLRSQADPRVVRVFSQWSACMHAQGYSFSNPSQAANAADLSTSAPTTGELRTAVADMKCKQTTNLIQTWYGVEAELEKVQIQQNLAALTSFKQALSNQIRSAAKVLGVAPV